jgi:hypothetical protein
MNSARNCQPPCVREDTRTRKAKKYTVPFIYLNKRITVYLYMPKINKNI